jgi:hypothetical protein
VFCEHRNVDEFEVLAGILLGSGSAPTAGHGFGEEAVATALATEDVPGGPRAVVAARLRDTAAVVGFYGHDPLLTTLAGLRRQRHELDATIRRLLAYGREFVRPRPYRLVDLADAAGMSISGVRTAYDAEDVVQVSASTGLIATRSAAADGAS